MFEILGVIVGLGALFALYRWRQSKKKIGPVGAKGDGGTKGRGPVKRNP